MSWPKGLQAPGGRPQRCARGTAARTGGMESAREQEALAIRDSSPGQAAGPRGFVTRGSERPSPRPSWPHSLNRKEATGIPRSGRQPVSCSKGNAGARRQRCDCPPLTQTPPTPTPPLQRTNLAQPWQSSLCERPASSGSQETSRTLHTRIPGLVWRGILKVMVPWRET